MHKCNPSPPRQRKAEPEAMSGGARCCFGLLTLVAQILLHGVLALTLYWVIQYRWQVLLLQPFGSSGVSGTCVHYLVLPGSIPAPCSPSCTFVDPRVPAGQAGAAVCLEDPGGVSGREGGRA